MQSHVMTLLWFVMVLRLDGCEVPAFLSRQKPKLNDVTVTNVATKSLGQHTTEGELWVSGKATIRNNTSTQRRIEVRIQGIDGDGFEVEDIYLEADFAPGETRQLTSREFMPDSMFARITHWQVGSITFLN